MNGYLYMYVCCEKQEYEMLSRSIPPRTGECWYSQNLKGDRIAPSAVGDSLSLFPLLLQRLSFRGEKAAVLLATPPLALICHVATKLDTPHASTRSAAVSHRGIRHRVEFQTQISFDFDSIFPRVVETSGARRWCMWSGIDGGRCKDFLGRKRRRGNVTFLRDGHVVALLSLARTPSAPFLGSWFGRSWKDTLCNRHRSQLDGSS